MSYNLWRHFFNDDVDNFQQLLSSATFDRNTSKAHIQINTSQNLKVGSPGSLSTSPRAPQLKGRKSHGGNTSAIQGRSNAISLTRSDVNARDGQGRTLLHHIASSSGKHALEFMQALLAVPLLDLYVQDTESGWTALHRALYHGNVAAAQALMVKDVQNATDYTTNISHANAGGLIKIKDHEGNSPFELFDLTTAPRNLHEGATPDAGDDASVLTVDMDDGRQDFDRSKRTLHSQFNLLGDEVFAFGSNKNITLGLGDGDDRQFPERIVLQRPEHLVRRLWYDHVNQSRAALINNDLAATIYELEDKETLPAIVQNQAIVIQNVVMSKLHTAILTNDPISNLHICGFGPGGRLGFGDELTRFRFECIQGGGLHRRKVASIALGQDHSVAVCSSGEVFTWGNNRYGQLGYELPEVAQQDTPIQLSPRQIYGLIKKEQVLGACCSSIHSAIYTSAGLYTFGRNDGQLGLMDADARSLEMQIIPRRVGVSVIQHPIVSVAAIDRATAVLLENHEVIVFTHYMFTKPQFQLDTFGSQLTSNAFFERHNRPTKHIDRISAGGNTICAMSTYGEVFAVDVPRKSEAVPNKSTTNPSKARNVLQEVNKVWSIRKSHMAATDMAVGQDGSVILCTASGTVWRKEKRANVQTANIGQKRVSKVKDYKFVRIPNVFNAIAVRSNASGAFMAVRKDYDVMREQIVVEPSDLWASLFQLLSFRSYGEIVNDEEAEMPELRFWKPAIAGPCPALIRRALLTRANAEEDFIRLSRQHEPLTDGDFDVWVTSNVTDVKIPVHSFVLKSRSKVLRTALARFAESYYYSISDLITLEYGSDGQIQMQVHGADFLTIVNLVLYLYTDGVVDVWRHTAKALELAPRYRAVRTELMKIATVLELSHLERAVRVMDEPARVLREDLELAFHDSDLFTDADVIIELADGAERYAHSVVLQARCPFFEGLFAGHSAGMWMADRRQVGTDGTEAVRVDLKHVDEAIFELVLRHIYADTGEELFDVTTATDLDQFIDKIVEVMAVANELMLERLVRICQKVVGRYVTPRNICGLLNTIAESSEEGFKQAALEYVGLNLENMLDHGLLEELDDYLLEELDEVVRSNQTAFMPFARSNRVIERLVNDDPGLIEQIEVSKQRRLDSMRLPTRYNHEEARYTSSSRSKAGQASGSPNLSASTTPRMTRSPSASPAIVGKEAQDDLQFDMDDDVQVPGSENHSLGSSMFNSASGLLPSGSISADASQAGILASPNVGAIAIDSSAKQNVTASPTITRTSWAVGSAPVSKFDLRDIMQKDSLERSSKLTDKFRTILVDSRQSTKTSQKERKRQQQDIRAQQAKIEAEAMRAKENNTGPNSKADGTVQSNSPWQKLTPKPQPQPQPVVRPEPSTPITVKALATSTASAASEAPSSGSTRKRQEQAPARSVSSPGFAISDNPSTQIQSVRHTPLPSRSSSWLDAHTSMADILAQQNLEKMAIKEVASARSLQEIQEEQEFQAWWDSEARRVQEEEAATQRLIARASKEANRGSRGGGKHRGGARRSGTAQGADRPQSHAQVDSDVAGGAVQSVQTREGSRGRGRGQPHNRSRGRGRGRPPQTEAAESQQST